MATPRQESKPVPYDSECKLWKYGRVLSTLPIDSLSQSLVFTPRELSNPKQTRSEQDYIKKELELINFCNKLLDENEKLLYENNRLKTLFKKKV